MVWATRDGLPADSGAFCGHCRGQRWPSLAYDCYKAEDKGVSYRGHHDHTLSGRACQKWTEAVPHQIPEQMSTASESGVGNHAFCRNPDPSAHDRPWCHTVDPDTPTEDCDVPICKDTSDTYSEDAEGTKAYMGHTVDCNCGSDKTGAGPWSGVLTQMRRKRHAKGSRGLQAGDGGDDCDCID
ncbi:unnamed protein product [Vitrella brassicaformis CCMP3155]|uniref:Kringle domain-containing protein n=1 Tax=Vitrella brassicaformis (strain CCMP3155) TaxID=1169540 RepID=A0A0G4GA05_VITBC|nr:unnamed protein product [Vitrella brassicaformis CCMP3155]|eukprot:CEM25806.1 unnamed protein product [Vitrella brassicaformis CCMP3155]